MSLTDLPVFDALRTSMKWHQARQTVLAENIANADTPGYRGRDLEKPDFSTVLAAQTSGTLSAVRTSSMHLPGLSTTMSVDFSTVEDRDFETTPSGNSVVLEEQMMKVAANQMDYQAATSLYTKSVNLLRMALGRNG